MKIFALNEATRCTNKLQIETSLQQLQFEKYNARVNVRTDGNNFVIEADRLHITRVLYNLLDNALKYSGENPLVAVQLSELPNDILELKVSDNGMGIP